MSKPQNRRWAFHKDKPALYYRYDECVKYFLGICTKHERREDTLDLTDPDIRQKIIDMGMTATSERRWQ